MPAVRQMVIGVSLFNLKQYRMVTQKGTFSDSVVFWITLVTGLFFALTAIYVGVGAFNTSTFVRLLTQ